jgi:hypothetical protein
MNAYFRFADLNKAHAATICILFYVNLINYMDRSVVAGMMENIKNDLAFHKPSDTKLGLLQVQTFFFQKKLTRDQCYDF